MKKMILRVLTLILTLGLVFAFTACDSKQNEGSDKAAETITNPSTETEAVEEPTEPTDEPKDEVIQDDKYIVTVDKKSFKVNDVESFCLKKYMVGGTEIQLHNHGEIMDSKTIESDGSYIITTLVEDKALLKVDKKTSIGDDGLVYYTNSEGWSGKIYAYCWNSESLTENAPWPGEECESVGENYLGQSQYKYYAEKKSYDRMIFNNGGDKQTLNLSLNEATDGFYGTTGGFAVDSESTGKVEYAELASNLMNYRGGSKKICIYTPAGYDKTKKYDLLVMFDAQNLFASVEGNQTRELESGPWAVDVAITSLIGKERNGVIILGIDNSDEWRNSELTMSQDFGKLDSRLTSTEADQSGFFEGRLDVLGDFIRTVAIPYVTGKYNVDLSYGHVGICGSSSGGLAAYYLGLRDLDFYSYIGAFSPAVGLFESESWVDYYKTKKFGELTKIPDIFVYCGQGDELEDLLIVGARQIKNQLTANGFDPNLIKEYYTENAAHTETWWRIAFSEFAAIYLP